MKALRYGDRAPTGLIPFRHCRSIDASQYSACAGGGDRNEESAVTQESNFVATSLLDRLEAAFTLTSIAERQCGSRRAHRRDCRPELSRCGRTPNAAPF